MIHLILVKSTFSKNNLIDILTYPLDIIKYKKIISLIELKKIYFFNLIIFNVFKCYYEN